MKGQTNNRIGVRSSIEADARNLARSVSATRSLKVRSGLKAGGELCVPMDDGRSPLELKEK
jgi:hypothetical protein